MKFTLRDALNVVFRYSRTLVLFWTVVLIAALVFFSQTRKLYDSTAKILISLGTEVQGKADYLNGKNLLLVQREQQLRNEQQVLQSHEVMLTTAKWILGDSRPGSPLPATDWRVQQAKRFFTGEEPQPTFLLRLMSAAGQTLGGLSGRRQTHAEELENLAGQLSSGLSVKPIFDSDALDVGFRYRDPNVAQTVLRLIIEAYLQHHIAVFQNNAESGLLKAQLERSVANYHDQLGQFSSFMTAHRVYNDDAQVTILLDRREKLQQALNEAVADSDAAAARLASLASIRDSIHDFERYSTTEVRNRERENLMSKLNDASVEEQTLLTRHPQGSRAYQEEQSKLDEIRQLLEREPVQVVQETQQRKTQASELVESEIINFTEAQRGDQARIARLRQDLQNVEAEIDAYAANLKGFNSLKLELAFARQESEQMAQVYLESRLKNLTAQNAITDISIIDLPTWDPHPASPKGAIVLAAVLLLLVMGTFAVLFACVGLDTTVTDPATAELRLGTQVVGTIPVVRGDTSAGAFPDAFTRENHREFAKIYQLMRDRGSEGKAVLFAESNSNEGASLVGYAFAKFLSRYAHEKTVFVDRTAHSIAEPGEKKDGVADGPEVLAWPGNDGDMAGGEDGALPVLTKLRRQFDYVIIAAGAVKDATDLLTISGIVSAVFLIVEAGKTRRAAASYNLDLLRRYGFQGVRLILNRRPFYIPGWLMRFV